MPTTTVDPTSYARTRRSLHRIATHVLAQARHAERGRIGLRALPGGFGTPMFGEAETVLRVAGHRLVREWRTDDGSHSATFDLEGATLREAAAFAGVNLDPGFSVGHDTPELGPIDEPLSVDIRAAGHLAEWLHLGAQAVDRAVAALGEQGAPGIAQLWPEHFDLGLDVATPLGRCNLGMSSGDGFCEEPYAYIGPWNKDRPGGAEFWNAPFGAYRPASDLAGGGTTDAGSSLDAFLTEGLIRLGANHG